MNDTPLKIIVLLETAYVVVNVIMIVLDGYGAFGTLYNTIAAIFGWRPASTVMAFNEFTFGIILLFISTMAVAID